MLNSIEELESGAKTEELSFIDISRILNGKKPTGAESYSKMLELIEDADLKQKGGGEKPQTARQVQAAQVQEVSRAMEGAKVSPVATETEHMREGIESFKAKLGVRESVPKQKGVEEEQQAAAARQAQEARAMQAAQVQEASKAVEGGGRESERFATRIADLNMEVAKMENVYRQRMLRGAADARKN